MFYFDPVYVLFALPALLLSVGAQLFVRYTFNKYSRTANSTDTTGLDIIEKLSSQENLPIKLNVVQGSLDGSYNPFNRSLNLSQDVVRIPSIASVGIAAHEMAHAEQHKKFSALFTVRNIFTTAINITSNLGYFLLLLGFAFQLAGLVWLGVFLFSGTTVFSLITLPIEFDASTRAIKNIRKSNLLDSIEVGKVKNVLTAAAFTYVAASVQSLSVLLYFILRAVGISKREG